MNAKTNRSTYVSKLVKDVEANIGPQQDPKLAAALQKLSPDDQAWIFDHVVSRLIADGCTSDQALGMTGGASAGPGLDLDDAY